MKKMLNIILLIALTLIVALATPMLLKDPGYAYMRFGGYEIEMRFIVALGLFVACVILFWLVVYLMRLPKKTSNALSTNRSRKSFAKGLLALSEGRWKEAEKLLVQSSKKSLTPELSFMAAARAAVSQNKVEQAFEYLNQAENSTDNPLTVDLTRCEIWVKLGENDKAIDLLNRILKSYPNNPRAVFLMSQAAGNKGDWLNLQKIVPKATKLELLPSSKLKELSFVSIKNHLESANSAEELASFWDGLSKEDKIDLENIKTLSKCCLKLNSAHVSQKAIEKALSKTLDTELLETWSLLNIDENHKLKKAESWLKSHPENPLLLRICGQICMNLKLWGKTQSYLQQSVELKPEAKTYNLLGQYFDSIHETENALEAYRLAASSRKEIILLPNSDQS